MAWRRPKYDLSALEEMESPLRFAELFGTTGSAAVAGRMAGMHLITRVAAPESEGSSERLYLPNQGLLGRGWDPERGIWDETPVHIVLAEVPWDGAGCDQKPMMQAVRFALRTRAAVLAFVTDPRFGTSESGRMAARVHRETMETHEYAFKYKITHLLIDDMSCGGATNAERCVSIFSQVPLGFHEPDVSWLPSPDAVCSDLEDLPATWDRQPIRQDPTWWSTSLRTADHTVDGCIPFSDQDFTTYRDVARAFGFPDAWSLAGLEHLPESATAAWWSRSAPIPMMHWVLEEIGLSLRGYGGPLVGEDLPGRWQSFLDLRGSWKAQAVRQGLPV